MYRGAGEYPTVILICVNVSAAAVTAATAIAAVCFVYFVLHELRN